MFLEFTLAPPAMSTSAVLASPNRAAKWRGVLRSCTAVSVPQISSRHLIFSVSVTSTLKELLHEFRVLAANGLEEGRFQLLRLLELPLLTL